MRSNILGRRHRQPLHARHRLALERFESRAVLAAVDALLPELLAPPPEPVQLSEAMLIADVSLADGMIADVSSSDRMVADMLVADMLVAEMLGADMLVVESVAVESAWRKTPDQEASSTPTPPVFATTGSVHLAHRTAFLARITQQSALNESENSTTAAVTMAVPNPAAMNAEGELAGLANASTSGRASADRASTGGDSAGAAPSGLMSYASFLTASHGGHGAGPTVVAVGDSAGSTGHHGDASSAVAVVSATDGHIEHAAGSATAFAAAATVAMGDGETSAWEQRDAAKTGSSQGGLAHHGGGVSTKGSGVELAKKWCTTTPLANRLVTTLEGKPTCDCKEAPSREGLAKYLPALASGQANFAGATALGLAGWNALTDSTCRSADADARDAILGWSADHLCSSRPLDQAIASLAAALRSSGKRGGADADATAASAIREHDQLAADMSEETSWADRLRWLGTGLLVAGVYLVPQILRREETEADREAAERAARNRWQVEVL